jgi:hypothetical protein
MIRNIIREDKFTLFLCKAKYIDDAIMAELVEDIASLPRYNPSQVEGVKNVLRVVSLS